MQALPHVAAALAKALNLALHQNLSLQRHVDRPAARAELLRALAATSAGVDASVSTNASVSVSANVSDSVSKGARLLLGLSSLEVGGAAMRLVVSDSVLSCGPLLQQLSAASAGEEEGTKALLRALSHLAKLPVEGGLWVFSQG